jgi:hypothetical protein
MKSKTIEAPAAPGKFSATEEAILAHLYAHPEEIGAKGLASILKPEEQESWKDIEEGIKTLIAARLVRGKRVSDSQSVWHEKLHLTTKGEVEAIKQERRQGITLSIEFIDGDAVKTE